MTPLEHGRLWYDFIVAFAKQLLLISGGGAAGAAAAQRLVRNQLSSLHIACPVCYKHTSTPARKPIVRHS